MRRCRPDTLLELGCIGLYPAKNGHMVDRDAAVLQHQFEITVADREHQYQRTAQRIISPVNCRPLNA